MKSKKFFLQITVLLFAIVSLTSCSGDGGEGTQQNYNPTGLVSRNIDGEIINFYYDQEGRLVGDYDDDPSDPNITIHYNSNNQIISNDILTFEYDSQGNVIKTTAIIMQIYYSDITYDNHKINTQTIYAKNDSDNYEIVTTINYQYDNAGKLSIISDGISRLVLVYNADNIIEIKNEFWQDNNWNSGTITHIAYDDKNNPYYDLKESMFLEDFTFVMQPLDISFLGNDGFDTCTFSFSPLMFQYLTYYSKNNIVQEYVVNEITSAQDVLLNYSYTYDDYNYPISATVTNGTQSESITWTYNH